MKRSPINRTSKRPGAEYSRQATKWWRECIRLIWRNTCAFHGIAGHKCGYYADRQINEAHHVLPKSLSELHRHNPTNGILLCPKMHDYAENEQKAFLKLVENYWPSLYGAYLNNSSSRHRGVLLSEYYRERVENLKALASELTGE